MSDNATETNETTETTTTRKPRKNGPKFDVFIGMARQCNSVKKLQKLLKDNGTPMEDTAVYGRLRTYREKGILGIGGEDKPWPSQRGGARMDVEALNAEYVESQKSEDGADGESTDESPAVDGATE